MPGLIGFNGNDTIAITSDEWRRIYWTMVLIGTLVAVEMKQ
jgi:hypothetical protein